MIDYVKHPVNGELPFINVNGHEWNLAVNFVNSIAGAFNADAIFFHSARTDIAGTVQLTAMPSKAIALDEARLTSNGITVATIKGLIVDENLKKRARGEDVPENKDLQTQRQKLREEIEALTTRAQVLQKALDNL